MEKTLKLKLLGYLLISAIGFTYFILPRNAGVSVPLFVIIQAFCLWFIAPRRKPLLMLIPISILALNSFISANEMWNAPNFLVIMALYSVMTLWMVGRLPLKEVSVRFLANILENILEPLRHFPLPFKWCGEVGKGNSKTAKRVFTGIFISIPCLLFLMIMLSMADEIFSHYVAKGFTAFLTSIDFNTLFKIALGFMVGFYLFGLIFDTYQKKQEKEAAAVARKGDLIVLNILLASILVVYTVFVFIQFKYLFASGNNLPYGLTFTYYARRGFFELLFLSGLNVMLILFVVWLAKEHEGKWAKLNKVLCCYLCAVTVVLLISSFYRMWLYGVDDGLTRLRFLVFGFLFFEAVALIFTFFYIIKPKFNIIAVYFAIGLSYYLLLNIVQMDRIIARDQINRYFETGKGGIEYSLTLSIDAAPEIARLLKSEEFDIRKRAYEHLEDNYKCYSANNGWRQWNLSVDKLNSYYK
ncbi:MAG: DUF4173 domain-containing protein [Oscillospiraceae bacterium]|nr:DUF4173 domain-containing protein [Oscillospiraceae bacterium]